MKVTFIADLHGEDLWKKAIERKSDLFIFLGDYFDSFHVSPIQQLKNFKDLIRFGNDNRDKTVFLLGNHDIHYFSQNAPRSEGFNYKISLEVDSLYEDSKDLFKAAWQKNNVLVTHAGLCQTYYTKLLKDIHQKEYPDLNIADFLNVLWKIESSLLMKVGSRRGGQDLQGGIFWADMQELLEDPLQEYIQIVGHTPIKDIIDTDINQNVFMYKENWNKKTRLIFIDCLIYRDDKEENPLFFEFEIEE